MTHDGLVVLTPALITVDPATGCPRLQTEDAVYLTHPIHGSIEQIQDLSHAVIIAAEPDSRMAIHGGRGSVCPGTRNPYRLRSPHPTPCAG